MGPRDTGISGGKRKKACHVTRSSSSSYFVRVWQIKKCENKHTCATRINDTSLSRWNKLAFFPSLLPFPKSHWMRRIAPRRDTSYCVRSLKESKTTLLLRQCLHGTCYTTERISSSLTLMHPGRACTKKKKKKNKEAFRMQMRPGLAHILFPTQPHFPLQRSSLCSWFRAARGRRQVYVQHSLQRRTLNSLRDRMTERSRRRGYLFLFPFLLCVAFHA